MRLRFQFPAREHDGRTCIVVVEIAGEASPVAVGLVVDAVDSVLNLKEEQIEKAPVFSARISRDCIQGLGKVENKVIILLDIDLVCSLETVFEDGQES